MKAKSQSWQSVVVAMGLLVGLVACPGVDVPVPPDNDGIPDTAEVAGSTFGGLDLYAMGARVGQRDIFIELDNMTSVEAKLNPQRAALDKVVAAFAAQKIVLHFDVGDAFSPTFDPANYNLGNTQRLLPYNQSISLTPKAGFVSVSALKTQFFDSARNKIFYYMVLGSSQNADGTSGSSGRADILGPNGMVTFGGWALNTSTPEKINQLNNIMASTIMHEFGHNLGLRHGGNEDDNEKPNYYSIMNYLYQLDCLGPTTGAKAADRYFYNLNSSKYPASGLINNARSANCAMDYSNGSSSNLDENALNENNGMGRGAAVIDWNDNGEVQTLLGFNLNPQTSDTDLGRTTLTDYNDWANIKLGFSGAGRVQTTSVQPEMSVETPPSPEFFRQLEEHK